MAIIIQHEANTISVLTYCADQSACGKEMNHEIGCKGFLRYEHLEKDIGNRGWRREASKSWNGLFSRL